jgi:hypothetical protein
MSVVTLQSGIEVRKCPGCGRRIAQKQIEAARFNFPCACGEHTLNDYVPDISPNPRPGGRKSLKKAA